jgi:hypothetical protein
VGAGLGAAGATVYLQPELVQQKLKEAVFGRPLQTLSPAVGKELENLQRLVSSSAPAAATEPAAHRAQCCSDSCFCLPFLLLVPYPATGGGLVPPSRRVQQAAGGRRDGGAHGCRRPDRIVRVVRLYRSRPGRSAVHAGAARLDVWRHVLCDTKGAEGRPAAGFHR